jgi:nucleoside-diphosphate-sugar epimerase
MKVMLTGATGCLGSRIANDLVKAGHSVRALVRSSSDRAAITPSNNIEFIIGDLTDSASMELAATGCEVTINSAASLHFIPRTDEDIRRYKEVNVDATARVIEASIKAGVKQVIHMSSIAAMGDFYNIEREETAPCTPESLYGKSKLASEELALTYRGKEIDITVIRPGVIYGAWDRGTILKMVRYIDSGKFRFIGDGGNFKSLVSVGNVSAATLAVMGNKAAYGEVFLVVDKEKYTMKDIAATIAKKLDRKLPLINIPVWLGYLIGASCDAIRKAVPFPAPFTLQNVKNFTHSSTYSINKIQELIAFTPPENFYTAIDEEILWYKDIYKKEESR